MSTDPWPHQMHVDAQRALYNAHDNASAAAAVLDAVGPDLIQIGRDEYTDELERLGEHAERLGRENRERGQQLWQAKAKAARAERKVALVRAILNEKPVVLGTAATGFAAGHECLRKRLTEVLDGTTPKETL